MIRSDRDDRKSTLLEASLGGIGHLTNPKNDPDRLRYLILNNQDISTLYQEIYRRLNVDIAAGYQIDVLLIILQGGKYLGNYLRKKFPHIEVDYEGVKRYHGPDKSSEPVEYQQPKRKPVDFDGLEVLIIEDVVDYRRTLEYVIDKYLQGASYRIAALFQKDTPKNQWENISEKERELETTIRAQYPGRTIPKIWVHFPWEDSQFIVKKLGEVWVRDGRSHKDNIRNLITLGFDSQRIIKVLFAEENEMQQTFAAAELEYNPSLVDQWRQAASTVIDKAVFLKKLGYT